MSIWQQVVNRDLLVGYGTLLANPNPNANRYTLLVIKMSRPLRGWALPGEATEYEDSLTLTATS